MNLWKALGIAGLTAGMLGLYGCASSGNLAEAVQMESGTASHVVLNVASAPEKAGYGQTGNQAGAAAEKNGSGTENGSGGEQSEQAQPEQEESAADESGEHAPAGKYDSELADAKYCAANRIYKKETADPEEISLVFAGDILFDDSYAIMASLNQRGRGIQGGISEELLAEMRGADLFMVNNEFPYTNRGTPTAGKQFTFRAKPERASYLLDMGADIVSLANNHASDYGEVSLTDTVDTLNGIGMPFVGAGRNLNEAKSPIYFIANDKKIGILSASQIERMENPSTKGATETSPGVFRCLHPEQLLAAIEETKKACDYVIVYIHWGTESTDVIDHWQREQAPMIAAAGADLIIGDHPHVLQPIGYCGSTPVVYSLGNYLFNSKTRDTCLVKVLLDENGLKRLQFIPAVQKNCQVSMAAGGEKERILAYMRSISPEVTMDGEGYVEKIAE